MSARDAAPPRWTAWLEETRAWVEAQLERFVPDAGTEPAHLHGALRYAVFGGGKRLRPALVRLACRELGGRDEDAGRPAGAVELVHTYSLVHDDLPCMDDDALRRGRPTVHTAYDEATAVLVGDALQTLAFEVPAGGARGAELVGVLARAAGSRGMVGGQVLDLCAPRELRALRDMHARKTAALFGAACEMGALAAGSQEGGRARAFGLALGLCFQAKDDLLDVTGDAATLGKTPGKDAALERTTLVSVLGLEGADGVARDLAGAAREAAERLGWEPAGLGHEFVEYVLARRA